VFDGSKYSKGIFVPKHREKCLNYTDKTGNLKPPVYRSSYEHIFMSWLDDNANVLSWGSENVLIEYMFHKKKDNELFERDDSRFSKEKHRYYVDFYFEFIDSNGQKKKALVEVKPSNQCPQLDKNTHQIIFPKVPKKITTKKMNDYLEYCEVLKQNYAKWTEAKRYAESNGMIFYIITEKELAIQK